MGKDDLAILGGTRAVPFDAGDIFDWPIITAEDEEAVLSVLRSRSMSGTDITKAFESDFRKWLGVDYALGFSSGTAAVQTAMYAVGVGIGDEVIAPSVTYWASILQAYSLGATPVFADIDMKTLCINPEDIEHRISPRTKAIVVVHYLGHPADMDPIVEIAKKHNIKVIEDVSHAQGALYKGRKVGTIGDAAAISLMTGKTFAIGEAGMLVTDDVETYERALQFGHYTRKSGADLKTDYLKPFAGLPLGGYKYRMHQMSSAVGRVQIKYFDERCSDIDRAMKYFWELLSDIKGIRPHAVEEESGSTMGGWYAPHGVYDAAEFGGLSISRFCEAVRAEGYSGCKPGCNTPLHTHGLFSEYDVYGHGKPTRIANADRDVRELDKTLPVSEKVNSLIFDVPHFKHYRPEIIESYAMAFRKAAENYKLLLDGDRGDPENIGGWNFFKQLAEKSNGN